MLLANTIYPRHLRAEVLVLSLKYSYVCLYVSVCLCVCIYAIYKRVLWCGLELLYHSCVGCALNKNVFSRALELVSTTFHFSLSILCGVCVWSTLTIMLVLSFQNAFENFQKLVVLKPTVLYVLFTLLFTFVFFFFK